MSQTNYIGVDLSKLELMADLSAEAKPRAFAQTKTGRAQLIAALPRDAHVVCEASGGYERELVWALHEAGVPVSLVMPRRVRAFALARGLRAKTDPIDARLLTAFGRAVEPAARVPVPAMASEWQALVRARQALIERLNHEASEAEHCVVPMLQAQAQARCDLLHTQVHQIETRLRALLTAAPLLDQRAQRMQQVCGIGEVSAWTLLAPPPPLPCWPSCPNWAPSRRASQRHCSGWHPIPMTVARAMAAAGSAVAAGLRAACSTWPPSPPRTIIQFCAPTISASPNNVTNPNSSPSLPSCVNSSNYSIACSPTPTLCLPGNTVAPRPPFVCSGWNAS